MRQRPCVSALILSIAMCLAVVGCGDRGAPASIVRDSAGVRVVQNVEPVWGGTARWTVSPGPTMRIGELEGEVAYQLQRVIGAPRLTDGRVVVADAGHGELRFFDATGRHLTSVGGAGEGPGEFRTLVRLWTGRADSLYTWDRTLGRLSVFDSAGRFARTGRLDIPAGVLAQRLVGQLADGSMIAIGSRGAFLGSGPGGVASDPMAVSRFSASGVFLNALPSVPGETWYGIGDEFWMIPFTPEPHWALGPDVVYVGTGASSRVERWDADGSLAGVLIGPLARRTVEPDHIARYRDDLLAVARGDNERRQIQQFVAEVPFPETLPVYQALRTDAVGHVWVERYRAPGESQPEWWVFDGGGRWLGTVETPPDLRVVEIGADYLMGISTDELGIERVLQYALSRD